MKKLDGAWAMVICALGWSLAGVFIKYVNINSFALAGFRSAIAFVTIAAFSRRLPRFVIRAKSDDDGAAKIDRKRTLYLWLAALNYAATMILFCLCNKLTYSANAVLLQYTNPAWIIIFGPFFLGEKNTRMDFIAIGGVVIGMLLFFADTIFGNAINGISSNEIAQPEFADTIVLGNILALVSGVTFGLTTVFQRKQQLLAQVAGDTNDNTASDAFMIAQIITAVFGLIFVFTTDNGIPDSKSLLFLVLLGVFQMGIPNIAYGIGIKKVRALSASLITMLEPLMNPIWVLIFVHEVPSVFSIIGGIIILGFILLREIIGARQE
jgi:drug/metabolite transporter (DMT)-like permease